MPARHDGRDQLQDSWRVNGCDEASRAWPDASSMRAGEPAARRRLRPALSIMICSIPSTAVNRHLGQPQCARNNQQRAILELHVSKPLVHVRVVAQAIAARRPKHHDIAGDGLTGREQHAHGAARRHVVAGTSCASIICGGSATFNTWARLTIARPGPVSNGKNPVSRFITFADALGPVCKWLDRQEEDAVNGSACN